MKETNEKLFEYIKACPTAFQAAEHTAKILESAGYTRLCEGETWHLEAGKGYFVTRNGSSLIAFRIPEGDFTGFMMTAAHLDSPCFKIKENDRLGDENYVRLSVEGYGGMIRSTWTDRPLSVAGRLVVRTADGVKTAGVDLKRPVAIIPNVAIHMDRTVNDSKGYNTAVDMLPLYSLAGAEDVSLRARLAEAAGVDEKDILATDVSVYNPQDGEEFGGLICAPRLDDLQCAFASLTAFLKAEKGAGLPVCCLFDNEEVGSRTKQGAASTFLSDTLERICEAIGKSGDMREKLASGFLVSCDNAHAAHPNHPEYSDRNHTVRMNGGIVIKYNANQNYTTDAVSAAIFGTFCERAGVKTQPYANRADMPGGSTLGNIANTRVSLNTVDIGLAQLAMHSAYETAGADDTDAMIKALSAFFGGSIEMKKDGEYSVG